jgi:hypothetical protein
VKENNEESQTGHTQKTTTQGVQNKKTRMKNRMNNLDH